MSETRCDVIAIGASSGGLNTLFELLPLLPGDLPASVLVVLHRHPTAASSLVELLATKARMKVLEPDDDAPIEHGMVYVAPRDQHMFVNDGHIRLDRSPRQHHARPAIDALFRSAATLGRRVAGVLLTGTMSDGVAGLIAIREAGGRTIAQDPHEALFPTLPLNAIRADDVERILKIRDMGPFLVQLARGSSATPAR
jgi:two-component system chemotaxis response regulator CheB